MATIPRSTVGLDLTKEGWDQVTEDYKPKIFIDNYINPATGKRFPWAEGLDTIDRGEAAFQNRVYNGLRIFRAYRMFEPFMASEVGLTSSTFAYLPANPSGPTGVFGLNGLGQWGPQYAADPIVVRLKGRPEAIPGHPPGRVAWEVVLIRRKDTGQLALPGGIIEPADLARGDHGVSATLKRELREEAASKMTSEEIDALFNDPRLITTTVYDGVVVKDPRNTDCSWMETTARLFLDKTGDVFGSLQLSPDGVETSHAMWVEYDDRLNLYADHANYLAEVDKYIQDEYASS